MFAFLIPGDKGCYDDPLLHWPYTNDFVDIQCPKAHGTPFGDAFIDHDEGCMYLDGDGDFMTVIKIQYIRHMIQ